MTVFFFFYVEIYVSHVVQILKRAFRICVRTGISGRIYKVIIFFFFDSKRVWYEFIFDVSFGILK